MKWKSGKFSEVPKGGHFQDPVTGWDMIKVSNVSDQTGPRIGEAVIKDQATSPTYAYGHNKAVLLPVT